MVSQGDILKFSGSNVLALVVSKDFINKTDHPIVCPIIRSDSKASLALPVHAGDIEGTALYDSLKQLDLSARSCSVCGRLPLADLIHILDRIQSMFDYI